MACDMPEPCKFQSLESCQKTFLRTHKGVYLAPHTVVGLALQAGDAEKFPQALGFDGLDSFCRPWETVADKCHGKNLSPSPSSRIIFKFDILIISSEAQKTITGRIGVGTYP